MFISWLVSGLLLLPTPPSVPAAPPSAQAALAELKAGNQRFVAGHRTRSVQVAEDGQLREILASGQSPCAVIVACSDSRVGESYIFDQELGRLFVIRQAGNSPDTLGIASVEYAVEHLGCQVVVLLGHTSCGAVAAVAEAKGQPLPGNLWSFQAAMAGLLEATPREAQEETAAYYRRLAQVNAIRQARSLVARSELLKERLAAGRLEVVPALYDLATGRVTFMEEAQVTSGGRLKYL